MVIKLAQYGSGQESARVFLVAIVGGGKPFGPFAQLVSRPDFAEGFPWIAVAGLAHVPDEVLEEVPGFAGLPRFATHTALFQALPDVNLAIDLSDDGTYMSALRRDAPEGCSVLHGDAAGLIWELLLSEKLCRTCMTDLREAQDLFATLIDQVDEDILLMDTDGRIVDVNRSLVVQRGGTKDDYIGLCCWQLDGGSFCCPPEKGGCTFRETLQTGHKAERIHTKVTEDGKVRFYRIYTYPVFGQDGDINRIIEMRRDITHRTHMEQRLQQAEKMAAIGELSTYIAHEIRNPLFAIGGFANSLLRSASLDEAAREKVDIILKESKRLDAILKTTLNFARPTDASISEVDLNRITSETLELMRIGCDDRGLRFFVNLGESLPKAKGDPDMFKQCLINLVKNAIEAMITGGTLTVTTGMTQTHVFVTVQDTGHGIPDALREKVFSPFFSTKDKGAGLGLAMTKKIVEEMGGFVELVSKEGVGTSITLHLLPVLAVKDADRDFVTDEQILAHVGGEVLTAANGNAANRGAGAGKISTGGAEGKKNGGNGPVPSACPITTEDVHDDHSAGDPEQGKNS